MCWIKLSDGRYVKDPIFYGKEWFFDCRSDDTVLVVHIYREPSEEGLLKRMRKILRDANIPAKIIQGEKAHRDRSPFPPNFKGLKNSASVRAELLNLPMPDTLECHANVYATLQPDEDVANECSESLASTGDAD